MEEICYLGYRTRRTSYAIAPRAPRRPVRSNLKHYGTGTFFARLYNGVGTTALYVFPQKPFFRGSNLFHAAPPSVVPRAAADGGPSPTSLPGRHCRLPAAGVSMLQLAASPFCAAAAAASPCGAVWLRTRALVRVRVRVLGLGLGLGLGSGLGFGLGFGLGLDCPLVRPPPRQPHRPHRG